MNDVIIGTGARVEIEEKMNVSETENGARTEDEVLVKIKFKGVRERRQ